MDDSGCEDPQFKKLYEFKRTHDWKLPKSVFSTPHFEISELQDMKRELNAEKSKLNKFDLTQWSCHTKKRDAAGFVMGELRRRIGPELLTQAWCKFYEILGVFPVISTTKHGCFKSLHLCEAPGAFICALNHYLVQNHPNIQWRWHANTLNPDYEGNTVSQMIPDDRLIRFTQDKWLFGLDLTGDIQQYYNHVDIVNVVTSEAKVNLVTADGSIDCMSDPGEQEKLVQFLHYCETMTALASLSEGGSYVLKIFTMFEDTTICLVYLLNCVFDKTVLFKPCTSKSGNSELYLICVRFNGLLTLDSIWDRLVDPYQKGFFDESVSMFALDDIPQSFRVQLKSSCIDFFLENQIKTISNNIYYFFHENRIEKQCLHHRKIQIAKHYIEKYKVKRIPRHSKVVWDLNAPKVKSDLGSNTVCLKDWFPSECIKISLGKRIDVVYTSKFAAMDSIEGLIGKDFVPSCALPSLYHLTTKVLERSTLVINVKQFRITPYYSYQKDLFISIQAAVNGEKHIFFVNVPFHTHFLASLWCILASTFENVYFGKGWCLFHQPILRKIAATKSTFSFVERAYNNIGNSLFSPDVTGILKSDIFYSDLSFVPSVLKIYHSFQIPT